MTEADLFKAPPPPPRETSWGGIMKKEQITPKDYGILSLDVLALNGGEIEAQRDGSIAIHWGVADSPDITIVPVELAPWVRLFKDQNLALDYAQRVNQGLYAMQNVWVERAAKIVTAAKTLLADIVITTTKPPV